MSQKLEYELIAIVDFWMWPLDENFSHLYSRLKITPIEWHYIFVIIILQIEMWKC